MINRTVLIAVFFVITLTSFISANSPSIEQMIEENLSWIDSQSAFKAALADVKMSPRRGYRDYDVQHYNLHLIPDFDTQTMAGEVEIQALSTVDGLQVITVDMGSRIEADVVMCNDVTVSSFHGNEMLEVTLDRVYNTDELFTIYIAYHGNPPKWTFNFAKHDGTDLFGTMAEPEGARQWWPCNDVPTDKATVTVKTTVPDWMFVVANGLLTENSDNGDGTRTITWTSNYLTATYLVAAAGTNYETIMYEYTPDGSTTSMPCPVYVYPELLENSQVGFEDTVSMIEYFSETFGEYPFLDEKYGQVLIAQGGGMEHQTITHINAAYLQNGGKPNSLIAHELAHQWWGDYITMAEWPDIWLNESFATYSDALYHEHAVGFDYLRAIMNSYSFPDYEGSIYDPVYLFDRIVYTKGAFVLHMLRRTVGSETFFQILRTYYQDQRFAFGNAATADFIEICETVSGQELDWFFQQWIYGTSRPTIQYGWDYAVSNTGTGYTTTVHLEQIQENLPLFKILMDVQVVTTDGTYLDSIWLESSSHTIDIHSASPPVNVILDPDSWALAYKTIAPDQFQFTTGAKLPQAKYGDHYTTSLEVDGGQLPYTLSLVDGELPMGFSLNGDTGEITGFPIETAKHTFKIRASDSRSLTRFTERTFTLKTLNPQAEVALISNQAEFSGGDTMIATLELLNRMEEVVPVQLFIMLEISSEFFYLDFSADLYPSFSSEVSYLEFSLEPEFDLSADILTIPLPDPLVDLSGAWWCFMLNSDTGAATGPLSIEPFEFKQ